MSLTQKTIAQTSTISYQQLDSLHTLRGFCAMYVVVYHAKFVFWVGGRAYLITRPWASWNPLDYFAFGVDMLSSAGYEMVIFFFVLSGFFIRFAQLRKPRPALAFYVNRIQRIYPPYVASCLLSVSVLLLAIYVLPTVLTTNRELNATFAMAGRELSQITGIGIVRTLLFLPVQHIAIGFNEAYWSLLPEAIFYLLVPFAFREAKNYYVLSVLIHAVGLLWHTLALPSNTLLEYLLTYNIYFALGACFYDIAAETAWIQKVSVVSTKIIVIACLGLFGALLILAVLKLRDISGLVSATLAILSMSALLAGKATPRNLLFKALHYTGQVSFSLYLYHFPLLLLLYSIVVQITGQTEFYNRVYWLALPIVSGASFGLYYLSEGVFIKMFRKA